MGQSWSSPHSSAAVLCERRLSAPRTERTMKGLQDVYCALVKRVFVRSAGVCVRPFVTSASCCALIMVHLRVLLFVCFF